SGTGWIKHDGAGIATPYTVDPLLGSWTPPMGAYDRIDPVPGTNDTKVNLVDRHGWVREFTRKDLVPRYYSPITSSLFLLTNVTDPNGNRMKVWPSHAVADTQERLIFM